jgi:hypothetical protein
MLRGLPFLWPFRENAILEHSSPYCLIVIFRRLEALLCEVDQALSDGYIVLGHLISERLEESADTRPLLVSLFEEEVAA